MEAAMAKDTITQSALVIGLGLTGLSCVRFLTAQGYDVFVTDTRDQPPEFPSLRREFPDVPVHTGEIARQWVEDADILVVSPGMALSETVIAEAMAQGKPAIGDIELFARAVSAPVLAITGSNGKSTVSALAHAMCCVSGSNALLGGNIGVPALELLQQPPADLYVLELSSFQLETTSSLNALAAAVLNITPDHMDRYANFDDYTRAKARVFHGDGVMVLNRDDPRVMALAQTDRRVIQFGLGPATRPGDYGIRQHQGEDWLSRGDQPILACRDVLLAGRHNLANVLAAMALAEVAGVPLPAMQTAVQKFEGLPHRSQVIADHAGVVWINDSKGTNVGATVAALHGMTRPVILIAGGDGKDADFEALRPAVSAHARAVILIGRDATRIETVLGDVVPVVHAGSLGAAVATAKRLAKSGDAVLLSPACASFDMFRNYQHRGQEFMQAVNEVLP